MNLSVDEMLRLARKVYPGRLVSDDLYGNIVMFTEADGVVTGRSFFLPSLTGEDWQVAQALDCIVAAENSPQHQQYRDHVANGMPSFQAAISALLAKEQS